MTSWILRFLDDLPKVAIALIMPIANAELVKRKRVKNNNMVIFFILKLPKNSVIARNLIVQKLLPDSTRLRDFNQVVLSHKNNKTGGKHEKRSNILHHWIFGNGSSGGN